MEYVANGKLLRETGYLFRGEVNDVVTADLVRSEDGKQDKYCKDGKYVVVRIKNAKTAKDVAGSLTKANIINFDTFTVGDCYCLLAPYRKNRKITDYAHNEAEGYEDIVDVCMDTVMRIWYAELSNPMKYLIIKQRKIHIDEEKKIYLTYDLDLSEYDMTIGEKECAREFGFLFEELMMDEKYAEFTSVKLLREKNRNGGYEKICDLIGDIKNMKLLGKVPKRFDKLKDFFLSYYYIMIRVAVIIAIVIVCVVGIKILFDVLGLNTPLSFIGTENMANP